MSVIPGGNVYNITNAQGYGYITAQTLNNPTIIYQQGVFTPPLTLPSDLKPGGAVVIGINGYAMSYNTFSPPVPNSDNYIGLHTNPTDFNPANWIQSYRAYIDAADVGRIPNPIVMSPYDYNFNDWAKYPGTTGGSWYSMYPNVVSITANPGDNLWVMYSSPNATDYCQASSEFFIKFILYEKA